MTKEIICDIVAAEEEACKIIAKAQAEAREAALQSQNELKTKQEKGIADAKEAARQKVLQKKEELDIQTSKQIELNETKYTEKLKEAALKMEKAADFVAERILK